MQDKRFYSILISDTSITKLDDRVFSFISFEKFRLEQNFNLSLNRIDRNFLRFSSAILTEFTALNAGTFAENQDDDHSDGSIFEAFDGFVRLRSMSIAYFKLTRIPRSSLGRNELPSLKKLFLNDNGIEYLGDYSFYRLPHLEWLSLSFNKIRLINKYTFSFEKASNRVLRLELWFNQLNSQSFEKGAFLNAKRPLKLELYHNSLTYLPKEVFKEVLDADNLTSISVKGNPIECDCRMKWLLVDSDKYCDRVNDLICSDGLFLWNKTEDELNTRCNQVSKDPKYQFHFVTNGVSQSHNSLFSVLQHLKTNIIHVFR
ncbi:Leucine rich repeat containing protein 13-like protein [Leptotrombidium deliense]|uniref:Leucine rich repeat containing protein 13-like protein n=1 Tax=Leptotrombidium deliense TaxID=299467 RepID=A0A443SS82_9ACAR|nr:Leucine rich repeat containing protein 13-like protein [Leptotrombidium deliense]